MLRSLEFIFMCTESLLLQWMPSYLWPLFPRRRYGCFSSRVLLKISLGNPVSLSGQFSSVQTLSHIRLFATPWITAYQASLCITNSRSSLKFMSIKSVMPHSHLILCHPLLLLPPIPPSIRVFSNESTLCMRWPKYWASALASFPPKKTQG